jgi:hypothetical protein
MKIMRTGMCSNSPQHGVYPTAAAGWSYTWVERPWWKRWDRRGRWEWVALIEHPLGR